MFVAQMLYFAIGTVNCNTKLKSWGQRTFFLNCDWNKKFAPCFQISRVESLFVWKTQKSWIHHHSSVEPDDMKPFSLPLSMPFFRTNSAKEYGNTILIKSFKKYGHSEVMASFCQYYLKAPNTSVMILNRLW